MKTENLHFFPAFREKGWIKKEESLSPFKTSFHNKADGVEF